VFIIHTEEAVFGSPLTSRGDGRRKASCASARRRADAAEERRGPGRRAAPYPATERRGRASDVEEGARAGERRRGRRTAETGAGRLRIVIEQGRRAEAETAFAPRISLGMNRGFFFFGNARSDTSKKSDAPIERADAAA
jgi:hypothetical protein